MASTVKRRLQAAAMATLVAVGTSTAAYAWVSAHPTTGAGHVSTGGPLQNILVVGPTGVTLALDQPVALSGSLINDNTFTVSVARVAIAVSGINGPPGTCDFHQGINFFTTDAVPPVGHRFTVDGATSVDGAGSGDWSGGTVVFRSSPTFDQTACLGRKVTLRYTAVAG